MIRWIEVEVIEEVQDCGDEFDEAATPSPTSN